MTDEFTQRLTLSRHATNRRADLRTRPGLLDELVADAQTRVIILHQGKALIVNRALVTLTWDQVTAVCHPHSQEIIFLGVSTTDAPMEAAGTEPVAHLRHSGQLR